MTDYEKAVVTAYTGRAMLCGEKLGVFYDYVQKLLGRPVWTHELADHDVWEEIREKSRPDFIKLCMEDGSPRHGTWVGVSPLTDTIMCSECGYNLPCVDLATEFCPGCGLPMEVHECLRD